MTIDEIVAECRAIRDIMTEKAPESQVNCHINIGASDTTAGYIWCYISQEGDDIEPWQGGRLFCETGADIPRALAEARAWAGSLPAWETTRQTEAVKGLGRAIDGCRDAGLDMEDFEDPFRTIYDGLLPAP